MLTIGKEQIEARLPIMAVGFLVFCVLWPYANFWAFNHSEGEYIDTQRLVGAFLVSLLALLPISVAVYSFTGFRSANRSLYAAGAFGLMFFNYHNLTSLLPEGPSLLQISFWLVATLALCVALYHLAKSAVFRLASLVVLCVMSITAIGTTMTEQSVQELSGIPGHWDNPNATYKPLRGLPLIQSNGPCEHCPNIYYLMVDSHVRHDAFRKFYGGDYSDFIAYLRSNEFFVAGKSYSNYPVTAFSVSSTLNMDFIVKDGPKGIMNTTARGNDMLRGRSPVTAAFRARGYTILHTTNGFLQATECGGFEDRCIRKQSRLITLQELGLIKATPIYWVLNRSLPDWETDLDDLFPDLRDGTVAYFHSYQPRNIPADIPPPSEWPFFWFTDFMGMHNLAFDSECNYRHPFRIGERKPKPSRPSHEIAYREQVPCMHAQLREAIDAILEVDPEAIIVLQADHGSTMIHNMRERPASEWTRDDILEVFGILNAIRLPAVCRSRLYESISPVNTFRVILGCLDGKDYELLPDISYVAAYRGWWPDFPKVTKIEHTGGKTGLSHRE